MSVVRGVELPVGVVTLLFSDIEGSTRLLREHGEAFGEILAEHNRVLRGVWAAHGGLEVKMEGDGFFVAFADPAAAVGAAGQAQRVLAGKAGPHGGALRVRIGVHTGRPRVRDSDYWGIDVHYASRLCTAANGGQVLLSEATVALLDVEVEDLGVHALKDFPAPRRLFHLILDGRDSGQFGPPRTLRAGRTNLPDQLTSLVGREAEMQQVEALMGQSRVVTLAGAGGVGKTRLALAVAAGQLDGAGDGVWLVELAVLADPELVAREVARVLGVAEQPGRTVLQSMVPAIHDRNLLLVLDNCEHLVDAVAELVSELVTHCPDVVVLASSREPLGVPGERVYRVPPLSLPGAGEPGESDAVRLFVERARQHVPGFALDERKSDAVAAIARRLDGVPLAIELAAARLRSLGIGELRTRLEQSFQLLTGGSRPVLPRHQTLRALIDWSYELLSAREQVVLMRMSVFAGGFELEAAESVCAGDEIDTLDVIDLLGALVDKSLVQIEDVGERLRYRLLETVREYAAARLASVGDEHRDRTRRAHRDYYLGFAENAEPYVMGPDQMAWLDGLELEHDNLRTALRYCLDDADPEPGLRLAVALDGYRQTRGYGAESAAALQTQLDRPHASHPGLPRARALVAAGRGLGVYLADFRRGERYCEEAMAIARLHSDDRVTAGALRALGWTRFRQGRLDEATSLLEEGVEHARAADDPSLLARLLRDHGATLLEAGADPGDSLQEAIRLCRDSGDRVQLAYALDQLGLHALGGGEINAARAHFQEAARLAGELGATTLLLGTSINLGMACYLAGDRQRGRLAFIDSLDACRRHSRDSLPYALLGVALTTGGSEPVHAARLHGAVDAMLERAGAQLERLEAELCKKDRHRLEAILGHEGFQQAIADGRTRPTEALIAEALAPHAEPPPDMISRAPLP